MSAICNYAILRFQPYPETGEFANLGIVMLCNDGTFLHKLETRHHARITNFFTKLERSVLTSARKAMGEELARIQKLMDDHKYDRKIQLGVFKHLINPRETMMRFGPPGTIAAESPEKALDQLFMSYVHHEFGAKVDAEQDLTKRVNKLLKELPSRHYDKGTIDAGIYKVTFPFVWRDNIRALQAIKPISFDLDDPNSIIEKGDKWIAKMDRLIKSKNAPKDAVFIARPPAVKSGPRLKAYGEISRELESRDHVRVLLHNMNKADLRQEIATIH